MKKVITLIILAALIILGAYWLSTLIKPETTTPTVENVVEEEGNTTQLDTNLVIKGPISVAQDAAGAYLADKGGFTLYVNVQDESASGKITPTCNATCEKSWPPFLLGESEVAPEKSTDPVLSKLNLFKRADGKTQYALGTKPLYYSILDKNPGNITPSAGNWLIARP